MNSMRAQHFRRNCAQHSAAAPAFFRVRAVRIETVTLLPSAELRWGRIGLAGSTTAAPSYDLRRTYSLRV